MDGHIPFSQTRARLRRLATPKIGTALDELQNVSSLLNLIAVGAELGVSRAMTLHFSNLAQDDSRQWEPLAEAVYDEMGKRIPLNDFWAEGIMEGDGPPDYIPIALGNLATSWDAFDEVANNPEDISPDWASVAFAFWLNHSLLDEYWETAAAHFGWPVDQLPDFLKADPAPGHRRYIDCERLLVLLEEAGLSEFGAAFSMSWFETGSRFLDLDDQRLSDGGEAPELTVAALRSLTAEANIARTTIEQAEAASQRAADDPQIYLWLLDLYRAALTEETDD